MTVMTGIFIPMQTHKRETNLHVYANGVRVSLMRKWYTHGTHTYVHVHTCIYVDRQWTLRHTVHVRTCSWFHCYFLKYRYCIYIQRLMYMYIGEDKCSECNNKYYRPGARPQFASH